MWIFFFSILVLLSSTSSKAFVQQPCPRNTFSQKSFHYASSSISDVAAVAAGALQDAEKLIIEANGALAVEELEPLLEAIEALNTYDEPNREPIYKGTWHVWYSNAPPPSNGQLGPFQGSAEQDIAAQGDYKNVLRLPPNSKDDEWLTVVLSGIWEDWDGNEIKEGTEILDTKAESRASSNKSLKDQDWGASFWRVTFLRLNFNLFGIQVLSKDFPAGVARVWRTTYLDDNTRIVRAGRTGRVDDESVFYMKRFPRPSN